MSQDHEFRQRWEFRRKGDDLDSSSDDSKSNSIDKPVLKKHKLVSNLNLPENDETSDIPLPQQEGPFDPHMGIPFEFGKAQKMHFGPRKKISAVNNKRKRGSSKKSNRKKNNRCKHEPVPLDEFKLFMKSIIEELKVARENMFTRMREEMKKLAAVKLVSRPTRKEGSCIQKIASVEHQNNIEWGMKTQNCNGRILERSVKMKSDMTTDPSNCFEVHEERVNQDQTIGTISSNEKEKVERLRLSVKRPIHSFDQVKTSLYLNLPTILSEPRVENQRLDSSGNYNQPGAAENSTGMNLERANLLTNASAYQGYFSGIQKAEKFGKFPQTSSQNMDYFDQHKTQNSAMGTRFPVPLHQGLSNGFNTPRQAVLENSSRDNNILGLRMDGGAIRFSGGSHALSEHIVACNFHGQMNYETNGKLLGSHDLNSKVPK